MLKQGPSKFSLYTTLGIIIISTVVVIMSIHSIFSYTLTKEKTIVQMRESSKLSIDALKKSVQTLIASYAVNEYENLLLREMERRDYFAIIVNDYNMGKILGVEFHVSGKIRDNNWNIIDFDKNSTQHRRLVEGCYYSDRYSIIDESGIKLGDIFFYISDRQMKEELNSIIVTNIIDTLAISALLIVVLLITIRRFILKPLSNIVDAIKNSDENGIPQHFVPCAGPKEINTLTSTMNNMISTIKDSRQTLEKQKDILHYQAKHDELTGLANRVLFNDRLEHAIEKAKRNDLKVAVLFIDLDHFKEINDSLGHKAGDKVLQAVTQRLNDTIRNEDTLARLGGDEFTIIIEGLKDVQDASMLADKIIKVLAKSMMVNKHKIYIGCSIGISIYPDNAVQGQDLLKFADAAMYKAKNEGRNNFQYYSIDMTKQAFSRVQMETYLRMAVVNNEFLVYYQPQVNVHSNKLVGLEALVRWNSPSMGLLGPEKFISIAESIGVMTDVDRFVIRTAMQQVKKWYAHGLSPAKLSVNITVQQLYKKDFIKFMQGVIKETGFKPEWLEIELQESQIMINPQESLKVLEQISDIGIKLVLDDFGTGYSSISYLKKLPISKLKIDKSFVDDISDNEEDSIITKAVIALADSLNLEIIAEGVETDEQKEFLEKSGCENIQGYLYAKPLPADEMKEYMIKELQKF